MGVLPSRRNDADASTDALSAEVPSRPRSETSRRRRRPGGAGREGLELRSSLVVFVLLTTATLGSLLALGTVHVAALLAVTPFALAAGSLALLRDRSVRLPAPAALLVALAVYSAFQAMPLPLGVVRFLDPNSASIWETALQPFDEQIRNISISLDPGASMVEALKWLSYAAVFVAAASVTARRDLRWICGLVFAAAVVAAVVTLGHRLVGAESFFGIYRPVYVVPKFATAPLLNANNLAGYLNLGAFAGIGLMVSRRPVLPVWLFALGVAIVVGLSAVSGSRAGLASLLGGAVVVLLAMSVKRFEGRTIPRAVTWFAGASLVGGLVLFALGADRDVWHALFEEGAQKLALISWTKPLVLHHPWFGVGRGAFETAFPAYRADEGHHLYQFAENFVMQWCSEWGIPVALSALVGLGWFLRPARLGVSRTPLAFVASVGVAVLLAQNLLDLALEVAAVSIPLFALLGALWASGTDEEQQPSIGLSWTRKPGVALAGAGAAVWLCALLTGSHTPLSDRRAVADAFRGLPSNQTEDISVAQDALREELRLATHRHPADPFLPLVGALGARVAGKNPLPWLARAIERDPMAGRPYLLLAEVLAARGIKDQALLSIRQAVEREEALMGAGVRLALLLTRDPKELQRVSPDGVTGANMLTALAIMPEAREMRPALLEAAIAKEGQFARPRLVLAEDLLQALDEGQSPCDKEQERCSARVAALAADIARHDRTLEAPVIFTARLLAQASRLGEAVAHLDANCPRFSPGMECRRWEVTFAHKARDEAALERASAAYLSAACDNARTCGAAAAWLGVQYETVGDHARALKMFERSAHESETPQAWGNVAKLATQLGFVGEAKRARERAGRAPAPVAPVTPEQTDRERLRGLVEEKTAP